MLETPLQKIMTMNDRLGYLEECYILRGSFKAWNKQRTFCTPWKDWASCSRREKENANIRELFQDEVVLDIDGPDRQTTENTAIDLTFKLQAEGYFFSVWFSGSKGHHVHVYFPELKDKTPEERRQIRLWFCKRYGTDTAKQSGGIAIECRPHFKTGKPKIKIIDNFSDRSNVLPPESLQSIRPATDLNLLPLQQPYTGELEEHPLVKFCRENIIPDGLGRYRLIRNLAILAHEKGMTREQFTEWAKSFLPNMPEKNVHDFLAWWNCTKTKEVSLPDALSVVLRSEKQKEAATEALRSLSRSDFENLFLASVEATYGH